MPSKCSRFIIFDFFCGRRSRRTREDFFVHREIAFFVRFTQFFYRSWPCDVAKQVLEHLDGMLIQISGPSQKSQRVFRLALEQMFGSFSGWWLTSKTHTISYQPSGRITWRVFPSKFNEKFKFISDIACGQLQDHLRILTHNFFSCYLPESDSLGEASSSIFGSPPENNKCEWQFSTWTDIEKMSFSLLLRLGEHTMFVWVLQLNALSKTRREEKKIK